METGTLNINTNVSKDDLKFKSEVYDKMSTLSLDSSITNISNMFADRTDLVNIPTINLINITNMENTFLNCNNLSSVSYTKITNMLPNATNLTNQYLSNIGLNVSNFTNDQINILNSKGFVDAVIPEPITKLTYYNIYYNTNDEGAESSEEV